MHTQDHSHLSVGSTPLPAPRRRIASDRCDELLKGRESVVSKRSTSRGQFPRNGIVKESQTVAFRDRHSNTIFEKSCTFVRISTA